MSNRLIMCIVGGTILVLVVATFFVTTCELGWSFGNGKCSRASLNESLESNLIGSWKAVGDTKIAEEIEFKVEGAGSQKSRVFRSWLGSRPFCNGTWNLSEAGLDIDCRGLEWHFAKVKREGDQLLLIEENGYTEVYKMISNDMQAIALDIAWQQMKTLERYKSWKEKGVEYTATAYQSEGEYGIWIVFFDLPLGPLDQAVEIAVDTNKKEVIRIEEKGA